MRRLRPIFDLQEDLLAPPELAALDGATHERLVQAALRAARQTWELTFLRAGLWTARSGLLLLNVWVVYELASGRGPGLGVAILLLLLPCLVYLQWRGSSVETRLVRCALREVVWRERIDPAACFDCGAELPPESRSAGWCPACASLLRGEVEPPAPLVRGLWRPDPFHRGLEHATELRHLQPDERRRLAEEARAAARRAPIVRTLIRLPIFVLLALVAIAICCDPQPDFASWVRTGNWLDFGMYLIFFPTLFACLGMNLAAELLERREARRQLRRALFASRIVPASCFHCRQNLAGVAASCCPRCGAMLLPESAG